MQVFLLPDGSFPKNEPNRVGCDQFMIDMRQMLNVNFTSV